MGVEGIPDGFGLSPDGLKPFVNTDKSSVLLFFPFAILAVV